MSHKPITVNALVWGPAIRMVAEVAANTNTMSIYERPTLLDNEVTRGTVRHPPTAYESQFDGVLILDEDAVRDNYKGDPVFLSLDANFPESAKPTTSATLDAVDYDRVVGPSASDTAPTERGSTWRARATKRATAIQAFVNAADSEDSTLLLTPDRFKKSNVDGTGSVDYLLNGKPVYIDSEFFTSPDYVNAINAAHSALRVGTMQIPPKTTAASWAGSKDYWEGHTVFKWLGTPPPSFIETGIPSVLVTNGDVQRVYSKTKADNAQAAYEADRDAKNTALEAALFNASKGNKLSPQVKADLLSRPASANNDIVLTEADAWWTKFTTLVAELDKVPQVDGLTDSNLRSKLPNGAGGKNADELVDYVAAQRASGNTNTTRSIVDDIPATPNPKTDQPWWARVLDTVDGFGAGTKELLTSWGPAGTVGVYGGVKAVNSVSSRTLLWIAVALGALFLLK